MRIKCDYAINKILFLINKKRLLVLKLDHQINFVRLSFFRISVESLPNQFYRPRQTSYPSLA